MNTAPAVGAVRAQSAAFAVPLDASARPYAKRVFMGHRDSRPVMTLIEDGRE